MTKLNQDLALYKADDHTLTFAIVDANDAAKTMTAATSVVWMAKKVGSTTVSLIKSLSCGITLTDVNGTEDGIVVTLTSADTNITAGTYNHELECVIGGKRSTLAVGILTVKEDVIDN